MDGKLRRSQCGFIPEDEAKNRLAGMKHGLLFIRRFVVDVCCRFWFFAAY